MAFPEATALQRASILGNIICDLTVSPKATSTHSGPPGRGVRCTNCRPLAGLFPPVHLVPSTLPDSTSTPLSAGQVPSSQPLGPACLTVYIPHLLGPWSHLSLQPQDKVKLSPPGLRVVVGRSFATVFYTV